MDWLLGGLNTFHRFNHKPFEWLIREDIEKAGCSVLGAKLLQFFETPKSFADFLWTHVVLMLKGVDISVYLQVILEANLGINPLDAIEVILVA